MGDVSTQRSPQRRPGKIPEYVLELHAALTNVLDDKDRILLIQSLNQYQRDRNVNNLVLILKSILDTSRRREVYPLLRQVVPHNDQEKFIKLWHRNEPRQRSKSPARSPANLHRIPSSSSLPDNLHRHASDSGIDLPNMTQFGSSRDAKHPIKRLSVKRPSNSGFGFYIRGGSEHGVGLYVSSVDINSVAEAAGMLPGDHIIQVNSTKFDGLTHAQAVKIIQHSKKLNLTVRSVGRIPDSFVAESTCKWVDMRGRRTSPPPGVDSNGRILTADGIHKSDLRLLGDDDERKVNIFVEDGAKLGLMIRGGAEYGLGIFIAGVDPNCIAEQVGLKAGDQILDVNGQSFLNISHKKAVKLLKSTRNMILTLKDIGRLPFTRVTHDKTRWITQPAKNGEIQRVPAVTHITEVEVHAPSDSVLEGQPPLSSSRRTTHGRITHGGDTEPSMFHHGIAGSQVLYSGGLPSQKNLITEQARLILDDNELETLTYYLDEYCKGFISIDAFVLAMFDLLDTPAKMSLMGEIRGSVAPRDIDRFDDLVLKKEIEMMKSRQFFGSHMSDDRHSIHSYASSVSSFSGKGSSSSHSSVKGSLNGADSRPITPPQVPEVLPSNVKIAYDETSRTYDVYEATLTFDEDQEETFDDGEMEGLPSLLNINPMSLDLPLSEDTSFPCPGNNVSSPVLTSSPARDRELVTPTRTRGVATSSEKVGDNTRKEKEAKDSLPAENVNLHPDDFPGKRTSKPQVSHNSHDYVNADLQSTGKPQTPPNPFIFPSTFQGNVTDTGFKAIDCSPSFTSSTTGATISESTLQNRTGDAKTQGREKAGKTQRVVAEVPDDDLRPEVAKLPGRKRLASWGTPPDEEGATNDEPNRDPLTNGYHTDRVTRPGQTTSEHNQLSDVCSETSSPSESRQGSVSRNRKSWDGVRHPGDPGDNQKVSRLEKQRDNKERSCSDSNLLGSTSQNETISSEASVSSKLNGVREPEFVVEIDKSAGSLGLSLEGGCDAGGDVKIKSVKGNFAAGRSGRLKPGQVLLQVDDTPIRGMTSGVAVLTLRNAYSNPDSAVLKLLVRDI
ncbi:uncharacterized protein LOC111324505 isoform X3 [Stylophora pistillata]|uniref:uncharacterized protein LOC111324505 isoform X3 n=1 Tax=Stylophora pistillata TaxID=50429 RepID=UPI000C04CC28|nr:uncharacterized protein LOC111324505 isoform X3 [Stylophora pistillata]